MELASVATLKEEIFGDFIEEPPYGIGWWAPGPGTKRRILIADQLYCCVRSMEENMMEAALHWLEHENASERESWQSVIIDQDGKPRPEPLPPNCARDLHAATLVRMHYCGIIRALASALDCLGGVIIGVASLRCSILKADFKVVRKFLGQIAGESDGTIRQVEFAKVLESGICSSGPSGWLDWTLDFRNMLVHRGRRLEYGHIVPVPPFRGFNGRRVALLPRDPGRSDVEVLVAAPHRLLLTEDARLTLRSLIASTKSLLETTAAGLLELWCWRRSNPSALPQLAEQWKNGPSIESTGFTGYAPDTVAVEPGSRKTAHPVTLCRFNAAAVFDPVRELWQTFD